MTATEGNQGVPRTSRGPRGRDGTTARRGVAGRGVLLVPAGLALLAGLDAALLRLGLPAPVTTGRLPGVHGVLLVLGFVGTLIALERAVALGRRWAYLSPAFLGAGGLLLVAPVATLTGRLLFVAGTAGLLAVYVRFWRRQPSAALLAQAAGAVSALGAALLWLGGLDVPRLLPWLASFLVLTIAGERVELARVVLLAPRAEHAFLGCAGAVLVGTVASLLWPARGILLYGAALLALVWWLVTHDVARRMLRSTGLPRFSAACLLAGYAWLALAGALWLSSGPVGEGGRYDAVVHAVFLGFVLSMIMAHAPVILPAVLRRPLPYRPVLAAPAWLLHGSLALRVLVGDLGNTGWAWRLGGVLNIVAVLLFVLTAAALTLTGTARSRTAPPGGSGPVTPGGSGPVTPGGSGTQTPGGSGPAGTGDRERDGDGGPDGPAGGSGGGGGPGAGSGGGGGGGGPLSAPGRGGGTVSDGPAGGSGGGGGPGGPGAGSGGGGGVAGAVPVPGRDTATAPDPHRAAEPPTGTTASPPTPSGPQATTAPARTSSRDDTGASAGGTGTGRPVPRPRTSEENPW